MDTICIKNDVLRYIFLMAKDVYANDVYTDDTPDFLVHLTEIISLTNANGSEIQHLIDLAIRSVDSRNEK